MPRLEFSLSYNGSCSGRWNILAGLTQGPSGEGPPAVRPMGTNTAHMCTVLRLGSIWKPSRNAGSSLCLWQMWLIFLLPGMAKPPTLCSKPMQAPLPAQPSRPRRWRTLWAPPGRQGRSRRRFVVVLSVAVNNQTGDESSSLLS